MTRAADQTPAQPSQTVSPGMLPDVSSPMGWAFDTSYRTLPPMFHRDQAPVTVADPQMVMLNTGLAAEMGLDFSALSEPEQAALFAGNALPDGASPLAQAYAGHQFGGFTMLGDGRAVLMGEHVTPSGRRLDVQFKGSGQTPFSRRGDGRAALGPMLREFIISEGMHFLGIPTTRSLAVVSTGEPVYRERPYPGAILTRIAASHLRVGTFEYAAAFKDGEGLTALTEYAIARHDPAAAQAASPGLAFLQGVIDRQLALVVQWMRVGFIHGVMNTDNVTISGETIDYGPCAFMDRYNPATVFSSIDQYGRYAYGQQPSITQWNLARFAESLLPLLAADKTKAISQAQEAVVAFKDRYQAAWRQMMGEKIGLSAASPQDETLIQELLAWMQGAEADYTQTFRRLMDHLQDPAAAPLDAGLAAWRDRWMQRLAQEDAPLERMAAVNPVYIPRNHLVEEALEAAVEEGDLQPTHDLLRALAAPYERRDGLARYEEPAPAGGPRYRTFCGT